MHEAIVILSTHKERGLFNADSLVTVLHEVRPDAIFLEHSLAEYESFDGLEKRATELYLVNNQVPVFPCGKPFPGKELFDSHQKYQRLSRALEKHSSEDYRKKYDRNFQREALEGFSYLHSHEYGKAQKWLHEEEERMIASTGQQEIYQLFQWWSRLQKSRELVILKKIEKLVLETDFSRVALLIGAEHRNSFLEEAKGSRCRDIEWTCYES